MKPPIVVARVFNGAAPGADTGILGGIQPQDKGQGGNAWRVTVALQNASVLNITATQGATTLKWAMNGGTALSAGVLYAFVFGVDRDSIYDFEVAVDGVIQKLLVEELQDGVS